MLELQLKWSMKAVECGDGEDAKNGDKLERWSQGSRAFWLKSLETFSFLVEAHAVERFVELE